tara:strand:+ start:1687 stop:1971 length:285 start_codon:yes stop_codon:yes gene_type:complete
MYLEIISPEETLFNGEIDSISVPGSLGSFQVLENHAPIVSSIDSGKVTIRGKFDSSKKYANYFERLDDNVLVFNISSGTIEVNKNRIILLSEKY